jgi:hypothetical protein
VDTRNSPEVWGVGASSTRDLLTQSLCRERPGLGRLYLGRGGQILERFRIYGASAPTKTTLERCAPGAFVTELQGPFGPFFLLTWPHLGARLESVATGEEARARLCQRLRSAGAPRELLERVESSDIECRVRVAPADLDGRVRRLTRRLAQHDDGVFTDARGWWDGSNAFLGSLVGATWSSRSPFRRSASGKRARPSCHTAS